MFDAGDGFGLIWLVEVGDGADTALPLRDDEGELVALGHGRAERRLQTRVALVMAFDPRPLLADPETPAIAAQRRLKRPFQQMRRPGPTGG